MRRSGRGWSRAVAAVLMAAAVVVPVATVATWAASDTGAALTFVELERRGGQYLQPLTRLLGALVSAQSAAVRGEPIDAAAVQAEADAVEKVDARHGKALTTGSRWPDLRSSTRELLARPGEPGIEAYQRWSQAVDLTIALTRRVGDTSKLILDPSLDSYYLMDAGLLRLPEVIQGAGQLADLLAINPGKRSAADELRVAVVRDRIATSAAAVNGGLGKVVDATGSGRVSSALLAPLDQFGAATAALAPSVAVATMPPLPDNVAAAAVGVRDAAERLAKTVWSELDAMLVDRADGLSNRRLAIVAAALVGLLVAVVAGLVVLRRQRPAADADAGGDTDAAPAGPVADRSTLPAFHPAGVR